MSSAGLFRKVDMDERSYWIYTATHPDESLAMYSGGDNLSLQPPFCCPRARFKFDNPNLKKDDYDDDDGEYGDDGDAEDVDNGHEIIPYKSFSHFSTIRSVDQKGESLLDCDDDPSGICKLPVVPLFWCNNKEPSREEFVCGACEIEMLSTSYYTCLECEGKFHKECVESPLEIKHPSHPFHSLRLYSYTKYYKSCICCKQVICDMVYHCTTCDLSMHPVCAMKTIPFVVEHPKSHQHPLIFFPAQASLVCNICATIKKLDPTYICVQCVFVIHEGCIGFPHVIRISRHTHRISFTLSLPSGNLSCGVCRQQVDNNYGAYTCKKCDAYFVHSKCALHPSICDGKELEEVPEEEDIIDDGEPFQRIADGIILHPFHSHHLRLEINKAYDTNKKCQGCALPTSEDQFYSCIECDFILHESCANAPRMIRHPLYPHPLTLRVAIKGPDNCEGIFNCSVCLRDGNGFFYEYNNEEETFWLDLRCASIIEPFKYQGHEHPLYLPWNLEKETQCQMCKYESYQSRLVCLICDYSLCYSCAALPYQVRYKHDSHLLTISDGKEASDQVDWCEICEGKIEDIKDIGYHENRKSEWRYYKCNDCCIALHVNCLLGKDMYMKPGDPKKDELSFSRYSYEKEDTEWLDVRILLNNSLSRPVCNGCMRRCPFPIVFKGDNTIFCSWCCIESGTW